MHHVKIVNGDILGHEVQVASVDRPVLHAKCQQGGELVDLPGLGIPQAGHIGIGPINHPAICVNQAGQDRRAATISYGRSLFNEDYYVTLRYTLSRKWEVESKAGAQTGANLYYRIEFD